MNTWTLSWLIRLIFTLTQYKSIQGVRFLSFTQEVFSFAFMILHYHNICGQGMIRSIVSLSTLYVIKRFIVQFIDIMRNKMVSSCNKQFQCSLLVVIIALISIFSHLINTRKLRFSFLTKNSYLLSRRK